MNSERHWSPRTSALCTLLIIKRAPFGARISNLVGNYETAGHTDDLGGIIVSDELRTLTLRTQSSRSRTRWDSRYLFQCLSHLVFLMLLILLDLVQDSVDECAINIRDWLHRNVWGFHWTQNIIDHTNAPEFVVADLCADYWYWILFESKEKIATLCQVQYFAKPPQ